jgi:hypothetical protein
MAEIPVISLKAAPFTPATFTATTYTPQTEDLSILERSLAQRETRMNNAAQAKSAVDVALGKVENQLHRDPTTDAWFAQYKDNIKKQIQQDIDVGNYGSAFRTATDLAGKVSQDTPLIGRIRANEDFKKEMETQQTRRDKGDIKQNTYDWWVANNPYSYTDIKDANGNIVGGSTWTPTSRPVNDLSFAQQATIAFKLITPDKGTTGRESKTGTTNADGTGSTSGSGSTQSYERVRAQDIRNNIERLLSDNPDGYRQAEQAYDVAMFEFNNMQKQYDEMSNDDLDKETLRQKLEERKKLMYNNGSPISYKEYYTRMITDELYSRGLAYDWRTDNKSSTSITDNETKGTSGAGAGAGATNQTPYPTATWQGPLVNWGLNYDYNGLYGSQNGILNLYK